MFKEIVNIIAYQRYATQTLHNALREKKGLIQRMDAGDQSAFDSLIITITRDIATAKNNLERAIKGGDVAEYGRARNESEAAIIGEILADIDRLEHLCREEAAELAAYSADQCVAGAIRIRESRAIPQ